MSRSATQPGDCIAVCAACGRRVVAPPAAGSQRMIWQDDTLQDIQGLVTGTCLALMPHLKDGATERVTIEVDDEPREVESVRELVTLALEMAWKRGFNVGHQVALLERSDD